MKTFFAFLLLLSIPSLGVALDVPPLRAHVNDTGGMLSTSAVSKMEQELAAFEKSDSTQIVVLTIPSLEGESLEEYSIKVAEAWKIGQKGKDNGAILLIVKQERKIRIEVGRGLEGKLTDLLSGRIIRGEIAPRFKAGDFDGGVHAGVSAMMAAVKGEYTASSGTGGKTAPNFLTLFLFLFIGCLVLGAVSKILGGLAGAVGLPVVASILSSGLGPVVLLILAAVGFLGGLLVSLLFSGAGRRGGGSGGGPFFGGGYGGGGFSGGGDVFSGGGGDFGGGGASGDW